MSSSYWTKLASVLALLAVSSPIATAAPSSQHVLGLDQPVQHTISPSILSAVETYADPVEALLSIRPELINELNEPRLIHVGGEDEAVWMTEGDKLRLRKEGRFFIDVTGHESAVHGLSSNSTAHMPALSQQRYVRPSFEDISTKEMHKVLKHLTSYYSRYYHSTNGAKSARWIHDHLSEIISKSPFQTYISLSYHTHHFLQPSIIARFEPPVVNASLPLTIIGAHQDSANYNFPLLPAPGADDDCSGTVSILEAFRVLAHRGFIPERGPVEFHWYAAEESGLQGSMGIAGYKRDINAKVGAMLEFDMTAFIAQGANETIALVKTQADPELTEWCADLAREYIDLPVEVVELGPDAGSDYMSWTRKGYPSAFATEGDPMRGGFPGDFDPYVHTDRDTMDIDDDTGIFSIDHMARFSELAIAFVVEQAGWSKKHTRADDRNGLLDPPSA